MISPQAGSANMNIVLFCIITTRVVLQPLFNALILRTGELYDFMMEINSLLTLFTFPKLLGTHTLKEDGSLNPRVQYGRVVGLNDLF